MIFEHLTIYQWHIGLWTQSPRPMRSTLGKILSKSVYWTWNVNHYLVIFQVLTIVCYTFSMSFHPLVEDTWLRIYNGHFRLIHCFKGVSKTKTPFDRYSAYQGRSLHTYLGFVPTQICTRQMAHLDNFVCQIWIVLARMSRPLQNTGLISK